jgi:hypothetical protein
MLLELQSMPTKDEEVLPVSFLNGITGQDIPVPTLYAIRFLGKELEFVLETLNETPELQELLSQREEEKQAIHNCLKRLLRLYQEFLMTDVRR